MAFLNIDLTGARGLVSGLSRAIYKTTDETNLNYFAQDGQMLSGTYHPLMRPGYLYPSNGAIMTLTVPSITDEFFSAHSDWETALALGNQNGNVYKFDDSFVVGAVTYTYDIRDGVAIEATAVGGSIYDLETYQVNGVEKLFYIDDDDVGIMDSSFGTQDDTYLSVTATDGTTLHGTGLYAFMRKSDNGLLYVFDDYAVHSIDGTATGGASGTAVMDVLLFPAGLFRIADAVDTRGKMYIAINFDMGATPEGNLKNFTAIAPGAPGVYVWNRISTTVSMQDFITIESAIRINRIWVGPDGQIYLMTTGSSGNNQIRKFDGSKFVIIFEGPYSTKISMRDGLLVAENMTFWAADDGYIYMAGDVGSGWGVFRMVQFSSTAQASSGGAVMAYVGGDSFSANSGYKTIRPSLVIAYVPTGGSGVVKKWYIYGVDSMTDATGSDGSGSISPNPWLFTPAQGDVFTPIKLLPTLSTVRNVIIRCIPTTAGSTTMATIKYYFNGSSTVGMTKTVTLNDTSKGYISHDIGKPNINSIQMEIEWNTANTMGVNDFAPYVATVEYDTTKTHTPSTN